MDWLNKPLQLSNLEREPADFDAEFIGSDDITKALKLSGYEKLFPVQYSLMKAFKENEQRDFGIVAPTGSGKTLAYIIPVLKRLCNRRIVRTRALIIVPTRVLVLQAQKVLTDLIANISNCSLKVGCALGKTALALEQNKIFDSQWERGKVDILIATPGRLIEHLRFTEKFHLKDLQFLIIDEADRLLEEAFQDWLQLVYTATDPFSRQSNPFGSPFEDIRWKSHYALKTILLSATLKNHSVQLAQLHLNDPLLIQIPSLDDSFELPSTLANNYIVVPESRKPLALLYTLKTVPVDKCILFCRSSSNAIRLAQFLQSLKTISCHFITSETEEVLKNAILSDFIDGKFSLLIATDGLARGLDIPNISIVINYDCPTSRSLYVHRAGRSARAGLEGSCYSIISSTEATFFKERVISGSLFKRIRPDSKDFEELRGVMQKALN